MGIFGRESRSTPESSAPAPSPRPPSSRPAEPSRDTVIAAGGTVSGEIGGACNIRIEGTVRGAVDGQGSVLVAEGGTVAASIRGRSVVVAGTVEGDILADERIQLDPSARVVGNLVAPRILIQDGAALQGKVEMKDPPKRGIPSPKKEEPDANQEPQPDAPPEESDSEKPAPNGGTRGSGRRSR